MLMQLAAYLTEFNSGFNVVSYLTMRAILSALTALAMCFLLGPYMIQRLAVRQIGSR